MSSLVGVIKLSWGTGEDVQAASAQCLQAALGMGCRIRPHASPMPAPKPALLGVVLVRGTQAGVKGQSRAPCRNAHCAQQNPHPP